ncbi:hypothetical protein [Cellulomonas sp. ICMP 17802]|uniref:hypothetical protein n=1 Tax=Cellulomonas sp. ICMP 17802 TaxID=3239199 RepID=UPI00351BA0A3
MAPRPDEPDDGVQPAGADVPPSSSDGAPDDAGTTDEEAWAAIVAQLSDLDGYDGEPETTDSPDEPPAQATPAAGLAFPVAPWVADRRVVRPAQEPTGQAELSGRDWDGTSQYDEAEAGADDREHFVPPDPGPVLGGDPLLTMAWFAAAGMPIFLLVVLVAWRNAPAALVQAAAVVFVIGVGVLVWRMPHRRDPDDDDTGAVV